MIEISNAVFPSQEQLNAVALGMRHAMNSEYRADTPVMEVPQRQFGPNDYDLALRLAGAGKDNRSHCKYLRMLPVIMTIKAPIYWWKEADTYKINTVRNSSSTMHKIASKEFTFDDFSVEHLQAMALSNLELTITTLNHYRAKYLKTKSKEDWWQLIQLLPSSYNQLSTYSCNYEVLHKMYIDRRGHKLEDRKSVV